MSQILRLFEKINQVAKANSPALLTALGASGTITTAYLTGKASFEAAKRLETIPPSAKPKEKFELVWDLYIPAGISGVITLSCIVGANHVSSKRITAAYSLLNISEKAFSEYKEKVVEVMGNKKEQALRDEIVQDKVRESAPNNVILSGSGTVLCCELLTGRYFNSDMETLRKAQNDINAKLLNDLYATLNDFYWLIGLPQTSYSGQAGWVPEKQLDLLFSTALTDEGRPCLAFEYNYTKVL